MEVYFVLYRTHPGGITFVQTNKTKEGHNKTIKWCRDNKYLIDSVGCQEVRE